MVINSEARSCAKIGFGPVFQIPSLVKYDQIGKTVSFGIFWVLEIGTFGRIFREL